jgi:hypothetical protein
MCAMSRRAKVLAAVIVVVIAVGVPVLAWFASPSPSSLKPTVRSALCERGRPADGQQGARIYITPADGTRLSTVRHVIEHAERNCCPLPTNFRTRAEALAAVRKMQRCSESTAGALGIISDPSSVTPDPAAKDVRTVEVRLGPMATRDDRRRVAAFIGRSGTAKSVRICCPEE